MSIKQGGKTIAGAKQYHPDLFDFKWADHILNDVQWLRADTFSWQSGAVYQAAYQHLVKDICAQYWGTNPDGTGLVVFTKALEEISIGSSVYDTDLTTVLGTITEIDTVNNTITVSSDNPSINTTFYNGGLHPTTLTQSIWETINGITIRSFIASDGHKICLANEETDIDAVYNATGVAWYYILDTTNQRFKLPRTKFGVTGLRDTVGNYVEPTLPNITGEFRNYGWNSSLFVDVETSGALFRSGTARPLFKGAAGGGGSNYKDGLSIDASRSSPIYKDNATVQPPATQMYLYFYVGNFTQTALENTAGVTTEVLNDKVDKGHEVIEAQVPTSSNNQTWYRKYADGWVEMGGRATIPGRTNTGGSGIAITFPVEMKNTFYTVQITIYNGGAYWASWQVATNTMTTTGFTAYAYLNASGTAANLPVMWSVSGVAA